ncbi:MAG: DNA-directed RNA polymerase subunit omega [Acidobacteria bacterium]|nr:DNA-directed RNA polymerase subunit omega [Acidobacteriota bacterium]
MSTNEAQNTDDLIIDSKYRKILIAAKRSKQLQRGARARVTISSAKPTRIALEEVEQGKIEFEVIERSED